VVVHLSAREAWQVRLDDGVVLELGRDQPKHPLAERLDRYVGNYAAAKAAVTGRLPTIGTVDLRYPNGFALRPWASGQS
jgi:cell division protein FtsQ